MTACVTVGTTPPGQYTGILTPPVVSNASTLTVLAVVAFCTILIVKDAEDPAFMPDKTNLFTFSMVVCKNVFASSTLKLIVLEELVTV